MESIEWCFALRLVYCHTSRWRGLTEHYWRRWYKWERAALKQVRRPFRKWDMSEALKTVEDMWIIPGTLTSLQLLNWMCFTVGVLYECQMSVLTLWGAAGNDRSLLALLVLVLWRFIRFLFKTEHYWLNEFILTSELSYCDLVTRRTLVSQYDGFLCKIFSRCMLGDVFMPVAWFLLCLWFSHNKCYGE